MDFGFGFGFGFGTVGWKRLGWLLVVSQASACSFIFEPAPGSANELRPDGKGRRCGRSFWYPLGDASVATTAATWAAGSNDDPDTQSNRSQRLRIAGWVGVGVFGASAIYGFIVEGRCALLRKESLPSEIRTRYFGAAQTSNRDYQALSSGLRKSYGPPQVEASALTVECQASLAQCLESGARPRGPVWHWPGGTIELWPHREGTRAVLDIRYAREEM